MFERFTERSRRVIVLAQEEARLLKHNYIGTEHLLLGMLADGEGDAARTLESLDITLEAARHEVREILGEGSEPQKGHIPFTPRAKKVLELALREALTLRSQSIGSVHLLLGLISEGHGVGAQIIERLGAPLSAVRERAAEFSGSEHDPASGAEAAEAGWPRPARPRLERLTVVQETLAALDRRLARIERHLGIAVPDEPRAAANPHTAGATTTPPAPSAPDPTAPAAPPSAPGPAAPAAPPSAPGPGAPAAPVAPSAPDPTAPAAPAEPSAPDPTVPAAPAASETRPATERPPATAEPPDTADPSTPEGPAAPDKPASSG
jgi:hypothetical protein